VLGSRLFFVIIYIILACSKKMYINIFFEFLTFENNLFDDDNFFEFLTFFVIIYIILACSTNISRNKVTNNNSINFNSEKVFFL